MKKIFTILAVLGALIFIAVPAQALVGMPDDQPGVDFHWWFLTAMTGGVNTLLVVYEVQGDSAAFDFTIYDRSSDTVGDGVETITMYDMDSFDGYTYVQGLADSTDVEIDLDGDGTNDHWFGYLFFDRTTNITSNGILAQTMLVNIPGGMYSLSNVPVREYNATPRFPGMVDGLSVELFSATALVRAKQAQIAGGVLTNATSFHLFPRYYVNSSSANNYLIVWKSTMFPTADLHVDWWDNDENKYSSKLPLPYELNIVDIDPLIPKFLYAADTYPKEGWIQLDLNDKNNYGFAVGTEWLAWTWVKDGTLADTSWSGLAPVPRDANMVR